MRRILRRLASKRDLSDKGLFMTTDMMIEKVNEKITMPLPEQSSIFTQEYFNQRGSALLNEEPDFALQTFSNLVTGLSGSLIEVNEVTYRSPIMLTKDALYVWEAPFFHELTPKHFKILSFLNPKPAYCIISCGDEFRQPRESVLEMFKAIGIKVDVLNAFHAASTFNTCMERGTDVIAFFHVQENKVAY